MAKVKFYETERDIERMFKDDIRDKRKAGSGSFKRAGKGSSKGRVRGGMKTHADMLKGKEKREYTKPGELIVFNLKDIISKDEFFKKSEDDQKRLLETWRDLYRNDEIIETSGITKTQYYDLVARFGLKTTRGAKVGAVEKIEYTEQEIERFKNEVINWDIFLTLTTPQKAIVLDHYDANFTTEELTEMWNCNKSQIYSHRYAVKKYKSKQEKQSIAIQAPTSPIEEPKPIPAPLVLIEDEIIESEANNEQLAANLIQDEQPSKQSIFDAAIEAAVTKAPKKIQTFRIVKPEIKKEIPKEKPLVGIAEPEATGTTYRVSGVYTSDELSERLDKINLLISGENSEFEINLTITEKPISKQDQETNDNNEKIKTVMDALAALIK